MVEEFMLLANVSVAEKILHEFPDNALLRRHPSPPTSNFDPVIKAAASKVPDFKYLTWFDFYSASCFGFIEFYYFCGLCKCQLSNINMEKFFVYIFSLVLLVRWPKKQG